VGGGGVGGGGVGGGGVGGGGVGGGGVGGGGVVGVLLSSCAIFTLKSVCTKDRIRSLFTPHKHIMIKSKLLTYNVYVEITLHLLRL